MAITAAVFQSAISNNLYSSASAPAQELYQSLSFIAEPDLMIHVLGDRSATICAWLVSKHERWPRGIRIYFAIACRESYEIT